VLASDVGGRSEFTSHVSRCHRPPSSVVKSCKVTPGFRLEIRPANPTKVTAHPASALKLGARHERFCRHGAGVERDATCYEERQRPRRQPGPQDHAPARLRHHPEPALAGGERLRMAEARRSATPGQVARLGESGLAVRLQLRRAQPDSSAAPDIAPGACKAQGTVCPGNGCGASGTPPKPTKTR
jgi:hypothetical protein